MKVRKREGETSTLMEIEESIRVDRKRRVKKPRQKFSSLHFIPMKDVNFQKEARKQKRMSTESLVMKKKTVMLMMMEEMTIIVKWRC